jgi:metallo-beta-lactamase family protein
MQLIFLGAAGTVTGSKTLIQHENKKYLIDAGMFQGQTWLEEKNYSPINPELIKNLKGIFITHAHLDHCGFLPYLVNLGYSGPIFMTEATKDLVEIVLEDALSILITNFKEKKIPRMPYSQDDLSRVISMIVVKEKGVTLKHDSLEFQFIESGHILGAASLWVQWNQKSVLFSGDLGRGDDLIHVPAEICKEKIDTVVIEGTYGGRKHSVEPINDLLRPVIKHIKEREGVLLIPSFAIARSAIVLKVIKDYFENNPTDKLKVFVDGPMMIKALRTYLKHADQLKIEVKELEDLLDSIKMVEYPKDRKKLLSFKPPYILVSSSGMLSGGRSVEHFERIAIKDFNHVLFVGYQGVGTLGRKVLDGEKSFLADGKLREIKAKIGLLPQLSAHADEEEMLDYLKKIKISTGKIFINHAEPSAADNFHQRITSELGAEVIIAQENKAYEF